MTVRPVTSEPVPDVVGQAIWGSTGPGTGTPSPTGGAKYLVRLAG